MALTGVNIGWFTGSSVWQGVDSNYGNGYDSVNNILRVPVRIKGSGTSSTGGHVFIEVRDENDVTIGSLVQDITVSTSDWDEQLWPVSIVEQLDPAKTYTVKAFADATNHTAPFDYFISPVIISSFNKVSGWSTSSPPPPDANFAMGELTAAVSVSGITQTEAKATVTIQNLTTKAGDFKVNFEFRDSAGVSVYADVATENIASNGTVTYEKTYGAFEAGKSYSARAFLTNIDDSLITNVTSKNFTTLTNPPPPPVDFIMGDLTVSVNVSDVTDSTANATVTVSNQTTKSGPFWISFEFRDASDVTIFQDSANKTISANGTVTHSWARLFQPSSTYSARAFLITDDLSRPLSAAVTDSFTTTTPPPPGNISGDPIKRILGGAIVAGLLYLGFSKGVPVVPSGSRRAKKGVFTVQTTSKDDVKTLEKALRILKGGRR
jgi:hypothetical protein